MPDVIAKCFPCLRSTNAWNGKCHAIILLLVFVSSGLLFAQNKPAGHAPAKSSKTNPFRVIAYYNGTPAPQAIPYKQLTHINFAFLCPNADGTFAPLGNNQKIKTIVRLSHENNVKVLISIGGWGLGPNFAKAAASPQTRAMFISEALKVVNEDGFDGMDIDWEFPRKGQSAQNYLALMQGLRTALPGKLLSAAVACTGDNAQVIPKESFAITDYFNVMTYDGGDHGSMKQFQTGLDFWRKRGVPPEKLVLGIPFYSRPSETSYRELVKNDPAAAQSDSCMYQGKMQHYNGIPTVQLKTKIAMEKASGIMFWTLGGDAEENASLLNAIHQTVHSNAK